MSNLEDSVSVLKLSDRPSYILDFLIPVSLHAFKVKSLEAIQALLQAGQVYLINTHSFQLSWIVLISVKCF